MERRLFIALFNIIILTVILMTAITLASPAPFSAASNPPPPPDITVLESDITVTGSSAQSKVKLDTLALELESQTRSLETDLESVERKADHQDLVEDRAVDSARMRSLTSGMNPNSPSLLTELIPFRLEKAVDRSEALPGETVEYTITLVNDAPLTTTFLLSDTIPENAIYIPGSATGGLEYNSNQNVLTSTIDLGIPKMGVWPNSLYGYLSLPDIQVDPPIAPQPCPSDSCDDAAIALSGFDFYFYGQHVTDLVWSTNGFLQVGDEIPNVSAPNQDLPDPVTPNNLIAPLWADLDLDDCTSGSSDMGWYRAFVTDGVFEFYVFEWKEAALKSNPDTCFSFQVWLKAGTDEIWFVYGPQSGNVDVATVGVENQAGTEGDTYFYNGNGSAPAEGATLKADRIDRVIYTYALEIGSKLGLPVTNLAIATDTQTGRMKQTSVTVRTGERVFLPTVWR